MNKSSVAFLNKMSVLVWDDENSVLFMNQNTVLCVNKNNVLFFGIGTVYCCWISTSGGGQGSPKFVKQYNCKANRNDKLKYMKQQLVRVTMGCAIVLCLYWRTMMLSRHGSNVCKSRLHSSARCNNCIHVSAKDMLFVIRYNTRVGILWISEVEPHVRWGVPQIEWTMERDP